MKLVWLDINCSYAHSSVALAALHSACGDRAGTDWSAVRATVNDVPGAVAAAAAAGEPDVVAATCWLFTHSFLMEVLARLKALVPGCRVILGGPEFLGDNEDFLRRNRFVDCVLRGEGEDVFGRWLDVWDSPRLWEGIGGICMLDGTGTYRDGGKAAAAFGDGMHFPEQSRFFCLDKPFVQLETSRGCFNTCAFCVSSGEKPVRSLSPGCVRSRLERLCGAGVRDVRVLDRTFNYDDARAASLLAVFGEFAGKMRFHLEIHPALLGPGVRAALEAAPHGLFHLEAGMQSLDRRVLEACGRKGDAQKAMEGLRFLAGLDNVQVHADLIAGLPFYSEDMVQDDVAALVRLGVDELQLESLKLLPGTLMRDRRDIVYSPCPPYEVLKTESVSTGGLRRLMRLSRVLDWFYNAPVWRPVVRRGVAQSGDFLVLLARWLEGRGVMDSLLGLERRGVLLYEFCSECFPGLAGEVAFAWVMAGMSLKKSPAGDVRRVGRAQAAQFAREVLPALEVVRGSFAESMRLFRYEAGGNEYYFGYLSDCQQAAPEFAARRKVYVDNV